MASSSEPVTFQLEALSALHAEYACEEKKDLKRKLADTKECLNDSRDSIDYFAGTLSKVIEELSKKRRKEDRTAVAMEDIKEHCDTGIALMGSMADKLDPRARDGISLSQAEVWKMMESIIKVSDCLTSIREDAVDKYSVELREEPSSDEQ